MVKTKKESAGEKAAKVSGFFSTRNQIITGLFLLGGIFLTWILNRPSNGSNKETVQTVKDQKVDTGSINNYNSNGDIKIENNTYNGSLDTIKTKDKVPNQPGLKQDKNGQIHVTSNNQQGGQTAYEINNNNR